MKLLWLTLICALGLQQTAVLAVNPEAQEPKTRIERLKELVWPVIKCIGIGLFIFVESKPSRPRKAPKVKKEEAPKCCLCLEEILKKEHMVYGCMVERNGARVPRHPDGVHAACAEQLINRPAGCYCGGYFGVCHLCSTQHRCPQCRQPLNREEVGQEIARVKALQGA